MQLNLQAKLLASVTIIVVLALVFLIFFTTAREREVFQRSFKTRGITLAQALEAGIGSREELRNSEKLQSSIYKLMWLDPEIARIDISVSTLEGLQIVASNVTGAIGVSPDYENELAFKQGTVRTRTLYQPGAPPQLSVVSPVHVGGQRLGTYDIRLSLETEEEAISKQQTQLTLYLVATIALLTLSLSLLLRRMVLNPVLELQKGSEKIRAGNLDWRIILKSRDELGDLASGFNKMAKELKKSHSSLEEKVEERTEELEGARRELETIIANFTDGLLVFDSQDNLVLINPRAQDSLKVREREVVGKTLRELGRLPNFKPLVGIIERHGVREEVTLREDLVLEVSAAPIIGRKEAPEMLLVVLHDITEEKEFEEMKADFASLAAHELRTPISAIKGYLASILEGKTGDLNEEQRLYAGRAFTANERQLQIVESLLEISKIEKGKVELVPTEFSVVELAKEAAAGYHKKASDKGLKLKVVEPREEIPKLLLDRERIHGVLDNLLSNAVKFTLKGGVTVSFEKTATEVIVVVADTGVGIPAEKMDKLFTKFYRVGQTPTIESEGTGLGLYIAKSLVELHQGKIWVKSEVNKGSTFYFSLPFKK